MKRNRLIHSAEGTTWVKKNHKYIRKEGNNYIYPEDLAAENDYRDFTDIKDAIKGRKSLETNKSNKYSGQVSDKGSVNAKEISSENIASSNSNSSSSKPTYQDRGLTIKQMTRIYGRPKYDNQSSNRIVVEASSQKDESEDLKKEYKKASKNIKNKAKDLSSTKMKDLNWKTIGKTKTIVNNMFRSK